MTATVGPPVDPTILRRAQAVYCAACGHFHRPRVEPWLSRTPNCHVQMSMAPAPAAVGATYQPKPAEEVAALTHVCVCTAPVNMGGDDRLPL